MVLNIIRQTLQELEQSDNPTFSFQTLQEALIANRDIGIVKEVPRNHQIERTGMELLLGFYSEVVDLHLQNEFFAHYELKKGTFAPLAKKQDKYSVLPLINLPYMKPTFITRVSEDIYAPDKLFLIGAVLQHETFRKEIQTEPYFNQELLVI